MTEPLHTILIGDVLDKLGELPERSVHCVVTSPPYWGLRDYGTATWEGGDAECDHVSPPSGGLVKGSSLHGPGNRDGYSVDGQYRDTCGKCGARRIDQQIGLEATPSAYIDKMVEVLREGRRVLRDDGTLWLNMGDSYAHNGPCGGSSPDGPRKPRETDAEKQREMSYTVPPGLKPKDLCGIPWRLALALQADGWWLRQDIIWAKPNPMPESVTDRCTKAHEYIFLLTKAAKYYYDAEAIREQAEYGRGNTFRAPKYENNRSFQNSADAPTLTAVPGDGGTRNPRSVWEIDAGPEPLLEWLAENHPTVLMEMLGAANAGQLTDTWKIATQAYSEAHFATFPEKLPERCIKAGTSEKGCCPECGAGWVRVVERTANPKGLKNGHHREVGRDEGLSQRTNGDAAFNATGKTGESRTLGWRPGCECHRELSADPGLDSTHAYPPIPATVLDPFMGSGTTLMVATQLGRKSIGIELNADYAEMAEHRIAHDQRPGTHRDQNKVGDAPLFAKGAQA